MPSITQVEGTSWLLRVESASDLARAKCVVLRPGDLEARLSCSFIGVAKRARLLLPLPELRAKLFEANAPAAVSIGLRLQASSEALESRPIDWIALVHGPSARAVQFFHKLETAPAVGYSGMTRRWTCRLAADGEVDQLFLCVQFKPDAYELEIGDVEVSAETADDREPTAKQSAPVASLAPAGLNESSPSSQFNSSIQSVSNVEFVSERHLSTPSGWEIIFSSAEDLRASTVAVDMSKDAKLSIATVGCSRQIRLLHPLPQLARLFGRLPPDSRMLLSISLPLVDQRAEITSFQWMELATGPTAIQVSTHTRIFKTADCRGPIRPYTWIVESTSAHQPGDEVYLVLEVAPGTPLVEIGQPSVRWDIELGGIIEATEAGIRLWVSSPDADIRLLLRGDDGWFGRLNPQVVRSAKSRFEFAASAASIAEFLRAEGREEAARYGIFLFLDSFFAGEAEIHFQPNAAVGRLDSASTRAISGWAVSIASPEEVLNVDVVVNDVLYCTLPADRPRPNLERSGLSAGLGGFETNLLTSTSPNGEDQVEIRVATTGQCLGTAKISGLPRRNRDWRAVAHALKLQRIRQPRISIVIPIYNGLAALKACIQSIVQNTTAPARLILVNDASSDPAVRPYLDGYSGMNNVLVIHNARNKGFSGSVNAGLAAAGGDDVVVLNSDTRVTSRWLENLLLAAHAHARVASATPLSNNAGPFSVYPPEGDWPVEWDDNDVARCVRQAAFPLWPQTPTMHGFCVYLRRDALVETGGFDAAGFPRGYGEENDLSMRARYLGWQHVIDDRTYIYHERGASFGEAKQTLYKEGRAVVDARYPEYKLLASQFVGSEALRTLRHRAKVETARLLASGSIARPRILYVIATRTGGTPQTNRDLMLSIAEHYDCFLLQSDGRKLTLYNLQGSEEIEVAHFTLTAPLELLSHRSDEYDSIVSSWIVTHAIEIVHIRHLAFHSLGLLDAARALGIPVVYSFHDYYAICPTIKLIDGSAQYCGGNCAAGEGECRPELWRDTIPPLRDNWVHNWRQIMRTTLQKCDAYVATLGSVRDLVLRYFPELGDRQFEVILHGRDFESMHQSARIPSPDEPLRILVPGNISVAKGAKLIADLVALDQDGQLEFHILGNADSLLKGTATVQHGAYERDEFSSIAERIRPHIGAIFSIWPETYSHTLTELWSSGIPVVGLEFGGVADRIGETGAGWLLNDVEPGAVYDSLLAIKQSPSAYIEKIQRVLAWQKTAAAYGTAEMAARYEALYAEVVARRQQFHMSTAVLEQMAS